MIVSINSIASAFEQEYSTSGDITAIELSQKFLHPKPPNLARFMMAELDTELVNRPPEDEPLSMLVLLRWSMLRT
jgi:hypothetical protein